MYHIYTHTRHSSETESLTGSTIELLDSESLGSLKDLLKSSTKRAADNIPPQQQQQVSPPPPAVGPKTTHGNNYVFMIHVSTVISIHISIITSHALGLDSVQIQTHDRYRKSLYTLLSAYTVCLRSTLSYTLDLVFLICSTA